MKPLELEFKAKDLVAPESLTPATALRKLLSLQEGARGWAEVYCRAGSMVEELSLGEGEAYGTKESEDAILALTALEQLGKDKSRQLEREQGVLEEYIEGLKV